MNDGMNYALNDAKNDDMTKTMQGMEGTEGTMEHVAEDTVGEVGETADELGETAAEDILESTVKVPHRQEAPIQLRGMTAISHRFEVPLDHLNSGSRTLEIFAREINASSDVERESKKPWLLYLQGGPGFGAPRLTTNSGWLKEATESFRVLLLDQRGTGLSSPVNHQVLSGFASDDERAEYLAHFRADSIVRDAELIRLTLGIDSWSTLGQSFGGFCTLTYLSLFPGSLDRSIITGGLAPLHGSADRVYQATFARMRARNEEYFAKYPSDRVILDRVIDHVRNREEFFSDGRRVSVGAVQMLGMFLGGNTRVDQLHFHLEGAFIETANGPVLSDAFKETMRSNASFLGGPLYAVLHESIYAQKDATRWSAARVLAENPDFDPAAESPLLTGEMIYPWHFNEDPALTSLKGTAEILATKSDWPELYRLDTLSNNSVPVVAAVYTDDVYVDRDLSLETANAVNGLKVWETKDFHHDGLADDGASIFKRLLAMTNDADVTP
ncbi:alpha/beta fold hydrolase [Neomicrococcus lactis]